MTRRAPILLIAALVGVGFSVPGPNVPSTWGAGTAEENPAAAPVADAPVADAPAADAPAADALAADALAADAPVSAASFVAVPVPAPAAFHQESQMLSRMVSSVLNSDGLLTVGLGARTYSTIYLLDGQLERISQKDVFVGLEVGILPWLQAGAEVPWRSWSGGSQWIPAKGSGVADGVWRVTCGGGLGLGPLGLGGLHGSLTYGGNLQTGKVQEGLGEGVFSPRLLAGLTWRLWSGAAVPEARLHVNLGLTRNRKEDTGYGMGNEGFQPWPPRYPAADQDTGPEGNDQVFFGAALEFRRAATSLWLEYSQDRFRDNPQVAAKEQLTAVAAGLRWGLAEGWALHGKYLVSLTQDDPPSDWYPAFPDWSMSVAVSRQFAWGGRDRDGDGVPDRSDACAEVPEDRDGCLDLDGCPDLDNDGDGIVDVVDAAPDEPEDFDGFRDDDGRPDFDNDGDGIADSRDLCPLEPEDFDGHHDDDGCPDDFLDADGDGVEDRRDRCAQEAEDRDGFEDDDGCPETDNDLDGIADGRDDCPDQPENYNGVEDQDGCPD